MSKNSTRGQTWPAGGAVSKAWANAVGDAGLVGHHIDRCHAELAERRKQAGDHVAFLGDGKHRSLRHQAADIAPRCGVGEYTHRWRVIVPAHLKSTA